MEAIDDLELWVSDNGDGNEDGQQSEIDGNPTCFTLDMKLEGQSGDFHVRNKPGQKQRPAISNFGSGPSNRPAFRVTCTARAIVHGILDSVSKTKATLLVYDFSFFSYRKTRIKDASICFQFENAEKNRGPHCNGPEVLKVAPYGKHVMMETIETVTRKVILEAGISGGVVATANATGGTELSVDKTTTHVAEIIGDNPPDDWGNHIEANWFLAENESQKNGIASQIRTCILLTRDSDEVFNCFPAVKVTPNFSVWFGSLVSSRAPDDPVVLDPSYEPYITLEGDDAKKIDEGNLAAGVDGMWDCTFHSTFGEAVKVSRT